MIQITNLADLAAFGGFNPNKYMSPMPMGYQGQNYFPPHMVYQQQMQQMFTQPIGFQSPAGAQGGQKQFKPQSGKGQRYEKKSTSSPSTGANKSGKKQTSEQKKYVTKAKKEEKTTSAVKPVEANAA
jgi:hypothetical protein